MTRSYQHHLFVVHLVVILLPCSLAIRGGRSLWDQFPGSDTGEIVNNQQQSSTNSKGRGFWGSMASSTKIEARNDNVNEDSIAEDIQPRVSSRYSEEVDEIQALVKRVNSATSSLRFKPKRNKFRLHSEVNDDTGSEIIEGQASSDNRRHLRFKNGFRRPSRLKKQKMSRRQGEAFMDEEESMEEILGLKKQTASLKQSKLSSNMNAIAVLDMIKNLQDEIEDINEEIEKENIKMNKLRAQSSLTNTDDELDAPVRKAAKLSTKETMKELALQKEDTAMKKVIVQMMLMKQIEQKKEENQKLELALKKLAERRKIINAALKQQKEIADEKRRLAQQELERQKKLMKEKEELILKMKRDEELKLKEKERREQIKNKQTSQKLQLLTASKNNPEVAAKVKLLEAHKLLVDQSNERILARIEEMKLERQREAIEEQEQLLKEQQKAISALRTVKQQRLRKQKEQLGIKPTKTEAARTKVAAKLKLPSTSPILNLDNEERKQVLEWLDLERNAVILEKTDKAIAAKLKAKAAGLSGLGQSLPSSLKVKSAAQVLINAGDSISNDEIDSLLGLTGIDNGLSDADILGLNDPSILALDDPSIIDLDDDALLFEDYEYGDADDYGDYDYEEIIYDYEYEDELAPEVEIEYEYDDYDYEYEEEPIIVTKPLPKPHGHPKQKPSYPKKSHGHFLPGKPYKSHMKSYPKKPSRYHSRKPAHSGAQFLSEVGGILGRAEDSLDQGIPPHITLSGSLRNALLRDVDEYAHSEIERLPGGQVNTKVSIGRPGRGAIYQTPSWRRSEESHIPPVRLTKPFDSSPLVRPRTKPLKSVSSKPTISSRASFSEIMGDLLVGKPPIPGVSRIG